MNDYMHGWMNRNVGRLARTNVLEVVFSGDDVDVDDVDDIDMELLTLGAQELSDAPLLIARDD